VLLYVILLLDSHTLCILNNFLLNVTKETETEKKHTIILTFK